MVFFDNFNPSLIEYERHYIQSKYYDSPILVTKLNQAVYVNEDTNMILIKLSNIEHKEFSISELIEVNADVIGLSSKCNVSLTSMMLGKMVLGDIGLILGALDCDERVYFENAYIEVSTSSETIRLDLFIGVGKNYLDDGDVVRRLKEAGRAVEILDSYVNGDVVRK